MAYDSTMLSFQMNDIYANWPANDMYGCSQNTLTQLQEKVLRSLSKKREDDSLQVVPENETEDLSPSPYLAMHEVVSREKRFVKESQNISECHKEPKTDIKRNLNYPWSPRFNKSTLLDGFNSAEPLRTPTFPFSPKNSGDFSSPASPLAMMLLSPFGRKPSEDLSMYLPENFTPAATLERLERSVSTTVFEFPAVEQNHDECKGTELKSKESVGKNADTVEIESSGADEYFQANAQDLDVFFNLNDDNCFGACKTYHGLGKQPTLPQNKGRRKRGRKEIDEGCGVVVGFRNKLERKRRSEMNSKYDKLRQCIPEIDSRHKVSKILVLRSAVQYIQELHPRWFRTYRLRCITRFLL